MNHLDLTAHHETEQTLDEMADKYRYNSKTGALIYKTGNKRYMGKRAGNAQVPRLNLRKGDNTYRRVKFNGRKYFEHRVCWALFYGVWPSPEMVVDHIDENKQNNRITNLQQVTSTQNTRKNRNYVTQQKSRRDGASLGEVRESSVHDNRVGP
jgi:hypothetical protein